MTAPYVPPQRTWRTRMRESVTEHVGLKLIALLLAVLLWLVVQVRRPVGGDVAVRDDALLDPPRRTPRPRAHPAPSSDSTVATRP